MDHDLHSIADLAAFIDPGGGPARLSDASEALAALVKAAFPAAASRLAVRPSLLEPCLDGHWWEPFDESRYSAALRPAVVGLDDDAFGARLRRFTAAHRLRIALREILPEAAGGASVEATARELSDLAAVTIDVALEHATARVQSRFGPPLRADGTASTVCVIGMGKLGGRELNPGSDVDLVCLYDSDDGAMSGPDTITLHEYWTRVIRTLVPILEEVTTEGFVWRVDLRLRPEGTRGALVNSFAAMMRYYETWGRLWERLAWSRARPVAGNRELGETLLREMESFVYRRRVDPSIAEATCALVEQARVERGQGVERDLKLGSGGIRDLEVFVQTLQLVWGGRHPAVRVRPTLEALDRLRSQGFVTEREAVDLGEAYAMLRAAEHLVQNASGLQTHSLPNEPDPQRRLARALGFESFLAFEARLQQLRERVQTCVEELRPAYTRPPAKLALFAAIDRADRDEVCALLAPELGELATTELADDLVSLASRPDLFVGPVAREQAPEHADATLDALVQSADPEQAARCLVAWSSHRSFRPVYASARRAPPAVLRRFVTALGGSAFLGDIIVRQPELAEHALFSRGMPSPQSACQALHQEVDAVGSEAATDLELVAGAIRRAKLRVTLEVVLADIAEEVGVIDVTRVLSSLADAALDRALRAAVGQTGPVEGMCVLSVGKLGGGELGYGSDLDVLFVFEPKGERDEGEEMVQRVRQAQRTIRVLSGVHPQGPGYELDTRLRPSGAQGVLVTSRRSFARYHGLDDHHAVGVRAAPWERQTLLRARFTAGDSDLGARVCSLAQRAAFDSEPPPPDEIHRLRMRLENEMGRERGGRLDIKLGRGGLLDIEFAVQWLQMRFGHDPRVRSTNTLDALKGLESSGALPSDQATCLREGYLFLRKLEQRLHVVHNTSIHLLEAEAPGLLPLARRMGITGAAGRGAAAILLDRYAAITTAVRDTYATIMGQDV